MKIRTCEYCHRRAERVTGKAIYPHRPDLHAKNFWRCIPCRAHVGCHPGTDKPLGRLANAELRLWKQAAHAAFDPIWKSGQMKRRDAYAWLAIKMERTEANTHIGMFDVEFCKQVVQVAEAYQGAGTKAAPIPTI